MFGFVVDNMINKYVDTFQWHEVNDLLDKNAILIDVREEIERELSNIEKSINIPLGELRSRLNEIPKKETVYVYCQVGIRGYLASRILSQAGYKVKNLDGGYKTYEAVYRPSESSDCYVEIDDDGTARKNCDAQDIKSHIQLNACGLQCPGPIMQVFKAMKEMDDGQILEVTATDPGFSKDIKAWCNKTGNTLLQSTFEGKSFKCLIKKGNDKEKQNNELQKSHKNSEPTIIHTDREYATIVVFSQDLDKAIASFIIASGAAAMGKEVTLFFTFWGLNVLRKHNPAKVQKTFIERMFGRMMPRGPKRLPISKMNMAGMGPRMIQYVMNQKNVDSLEILMQNAMDAGVKLVACAMSMDIMRIKEEELIDGVEIGGVASYLGKAEESNINLFI